MVTNYIDALRDGGDGQESVELRILEPELPDDVEAEVVASACYELASAQLRLSFARRCVRRVGSASASGRARLEGTLRYLEGDRAGAAMLLETGARDRQINRDPSLHLRLAEALAAAGRRQESCAAAEALYRAAPVLPGARDALGVCGDKGDATPVVARIQSEQRAAFLATRRNGDEPASTLSLEGPGFVSVEVPFGEPGKVSVVVFFSTWCPHCLRDLPLVNAFARSLAGNPKLRDRVRVVGVRTAVERERVPYEEFLTAVEPAFDIWFDATMSLQFGRFAKEHEIVTTLPRVAVADETGVVRFLIAPGAYRDVVQELTWAVEALLDHAD
jgi:thiol-disulfide isomerase/thioredoxin